MGTAAMAKKTAAKVQNGDGQGTASSAARANSQPVPLGRHVATPPSAAANRLTQPSAANMAAAGGVPAGRSPAYTSMSTPFLMASDPMRAHSTPATPQNSRSMAAILPPNARQGVLSWP